jgi:ssDNA-binding Zn-finger/Zn-ribbon topoisomerase 1
MECHGHKFYGCSGNVICCGIACEDLKRLLNGNTGVILGSEGDIDCGRDTKGLEWGF